MIGSFLFLVAIIDLFSRKVVGWAIGDHHCAERSCEAIRRALAKRCPRPGLIFHSDCGSEFAAANFRRLLEKVQAVQSMSRKGDCWDGAESFFLTLEFEGPTTATWRGVSDAAPVLFTFIESYYNQTRLHSHNDYRNPGETEADLRIRARAA